MREATCFFSHGWCGDLRMLLYRPIGKLLRFPSSFSNSSMKSKQNKFCGCVFSPPAITVREGGENGDDRPRGLFHLTSVPCAR